MDNYRTLPLDQESLIIQLLGEAEDLIELISDNIGQKGCKYYLQSLFLVLRQMGYFFISPNSPLIQYGASLANEDKVFLEKNKGNSRCGWAP